MEEQYGMEKPDRVRFMLYIALHIVFCIAVFLGTMGLVGFWFTNSVSGAQSDATGFGDLLNAIGFVFKGIIAMMLYILCVAAVLVWSAFLLILLRFTAVKKDTRVTGYELKATLAVTVVGVVLTLAAGMLCMGTEILGMMGMLFLPIVILEITVYWIGLWGRKRSGDLQALSSETAGQALKGDLKEEKRTPRAADIVRFAGFLVIHTVLCMSVFRYAREAGALGTVDGTDLTHLGIVNLLSGALYAVAMLVWSAVLLTPLRLIAVGKTARVTELEVKATLAVVIGGVVLTLVTGVICMGLGALWVMGEMFLPVLILEIGMYWIGLRERRTLPHSGIFS